MRRTALAMALLASLAGCGQRGDLYFPEAERDAVVTVPAELPGVLQSVADEESEEAATQAAPAQPGAAGNAPANAGQ